jgi:serine/threonine protein kinase
LYERGVIHRDVSPSNLIISDSPNLGGHIIDFDHSKIAFEKSQIVEEEDHGSVDEIASKLLKTTRGAKKYVSELKIFWGWEIKTRDATPADFHWPLVRKNDLTCLWC